MKLLRQTQWLFLQVAFPVFLVAGTVMYFALYWTFVHETEEKLAGVQAKIEVFVQEHDTLPAFFQTIDNRLEATMQPGKKISEFGAQVFSDTLIFNELEGEDEPFLRLQFPVRMHGETWLVSISSSTVEHEDLAMSVIVPLAVLFGLLFGVMFRVNRAMAQKIWEPFFATLEKMRGFRLTDPEPLRLPDAPADEFRELNATLEKLAEQVRQDFQTVKKFTENASHELQTPLAVIQNKVEMLLQDETLGESQVHQIHIIGQSTRRMARLNQSLLLLSKIENNQFVERTTVSLKPLLEKKLTWLEDFFLEKKLTVRIELQEKLIETNPFLLETLVTNLLTNAVKHNLPGGFLHVFLTETQFVVENSAALLEVPIGDLTTRFARGNIRSQGVGLGLAIVAEICEQQGFDLEIAFEENTWASKIQFHR